MKFKILSIILVLPFLVFSKEIQKEYFSVNKIWDGVEREYLIFLPSSYHKEKTKRFPLLIGLHGYSGTASGFELETTKGLNLTAEQEDIIAIYPQGSFFTSTVNNQTNFVSSWNDIVSNADLPKGKPKKCSLDRFEYPKPPECSEFNFCAWTSCHDDLGFLESLIMEISSRYRIDDTRKYMVGMSNGGAMVYRFACNYSDLISAAAIISSSIPIGTTCENRVSLPMLIVYGENDTTTPPRGNVSYDGFFYEPVNKTFSSWADNQNCGENILKINSSYLKNKNVSCSYRKNCKDDNEVRLCKIIEGGHFWPGQDRSVGFCNSNIQGKLNNEICENKNDKSNWGNDLIWSFLKKYKRI